MRSWLNKHEIWSKRGEYQGRCGLEKERVLRKKIREGEEKSERQKESQGTGLSLRTWVEKKKKKRFSIRQISALVNTVKGKV